MESDPKAKAAREEGFTEGYKTALQDVKDLYQNEETRLRTGRIRSAGRAYAQGLFEELRKLLGK